VDHERTANALVGEIMEILGERASALITHLAQYEAVHELPAPSWSQQLEALGVPFSAGRRVLLVDDEPENLEVLSTLLEEDYEVMTAASGQAALAVVEKSPSFSVVLSDQRMPGMTGMELLTELRRRTPDTVRLMLTGYTDLGPMVAAVNEGNVYRFFLKPWNPDELRSAVGDAVWLFEARTAMQRVVVALAARKRELERTLDDVKRAQAALLSAERLSTVGRFSAGIAHNIRNSLTVMMNLLELVQQNPAEQRVLTAAQRAFETLQTLLRLVNDVNALGKGKLSSAVRSPLEMEPFLAKVLSSFKGESLAKDREISVNIHPTARVLQVDPNRIRQALLALLRVVAHATAAHVPMELMVHPLARNGRTCFEVVSPPPSVTMGPGRPAAGRRFPTGAPPTFAEMELGLEICRTVAEAHAGELVIRARPSQSERRETAIQLWVTGADPEGEHP
jgi:CheY-like chemotaxis protein